MSVPTAISETSSQIIPLKSRSDSRDPAEFWPQRLFAFELRRGGTKLGPSARISAEMLADVSELAVLSCCASCRFARSFAEKVAWGVDYRKPPPLFRKGLKICFTEEFHALFAGIDSDAPPPAAKIHPIE